MNKLVRRLGGDGIVSVIFIIGSIVAYVETLNFPARAANWPQWLLYSFALLNVVVIAAKFWMSGREK